MNFKAVIFDLVGTLLNTLEYLADATNAELLPGKHFSLGDTSIDMQTARACGMYGIGVLWGFRPAQELIAGGARMLINVPQDLLPWI